MRAASVLGWAAMIARESQRTFSERVPAYRDRVERKLASTLRADAQIPERLVEAIEYSVLGPGKRVRPLLCYAAGEYFGAELEALDTIAAAVELVHAYSLVHDDLPAMDDDDLRRGRPTTHCAFDEATAILAGDGLQAFAFELLCCDPSLARKADSQIRVITWLARAAGPAGMVGGQFLDLRAEGQRVDEDQLEDIHRRKTGELIRAAVMMPVELCDACDPVRSQLDRLAKDLGLLFQIRDDLLEIDYETDAIGKSATSDHNKRKSTYPSILGIDEARRRAARLHGSILSGLDALGPRCAALSWLVDFIYGRER